MANQDAFYTACAVPELVRVDTQLYRPGTAFYHRSSSSILILTQDAENKTQYVLTTLFNRATPEQGFTSQVIKGSRTDGLTEYELASHLELYEVSILQKLGFAT